MFFNLILFYFYTIIQFLFSYFVAKIINKQIYKLCIKS